MLTATTVIYTLSLHDALPISSKFPSARFPSVEIASTLYVSITGALTGCGSELAGAARVRARVMGDRKSTRLNSSHQIISYAVFCLKKKKRNRKQIINKYIRKT